MDHRDRIILKIAESACERVSRKTVLALQKMTEGMQSGDDTSLRNIWDEVCVRVQQEESVMWETYLIVIKSIITHEVQILETPIKQAIWLQTDNGKQWEVRTENESEHQEKGKEDCPYSEDDITEHILNSFVLTAAAGWSN